MAVKRDMMIAMDPVMAQKSPIVPTSRVSAPNFIILLLNFVSAVAKGISANMLKFSSKRLFSI